MKIIKDDRHWKMYKIFQLFKINERIIVIYSKKDAWKDAFKFILTNFKDLINSTMDIANNIFTIILSLIIIPLILPWTLINNIPEIILYRGNLTDDELCEIDNDVNESKLKVKEIFENSKLEE